MQMLMQWFGTLFGAKDQYAMTRTAFAILSELRGELDEIADRPNHHQTDSIEEIVPFFQAIAKVQDTFWVKSAIDELEPLRDQSNLVGTLKELNLHLIRAGRDEYGMNRTTIGQPVTDEDVYLGNIGGYITKSVAYIKSHRDDQAFYATVNAQAVRFMNSHIGPMIHLINEFERVMSAKTA